MKILSLNREGTVLELLQDRMCKVSLGNLPITVSLDDVEFSSQGIAKEPQKTRVQTSFSSDVESEELDLHGRNIEQSLTQLEDKINRALMHKMHRLKIVHGIGSGKVKDAIHTYLGSSKYVQRYVLDDFNPGVTWVYL